MLLYHVSSFRQGLNPYCFGLWSLRLSRHSFMKRRQPVLILIVLDYGHWADDDLVAELKRRVLILIVLDYGHWAHTRLLKSTEQRRLNPYCFGLWSLRKRCELMASFLLSLNPYCFGLWSLSKLFFTYGAKTGGLNPYCFGLWSLRYMTCKVLDSRGRVLILIVLDYGHWDLQRCLKLRNKAS